MKTIWKFELTGTDTVVQMPEDAKVLSAQRQNTKICIWAMVDDQAKKVARNFVIQATGEWLEGPASDPDVKMVFIDTIQVAGFVWHIFEVKS